MSHIWEIFSGASRVIKKRDGVLRREGVVYYFLCTALSVLQAKIDRCINNNTESLTKDGIKKVDLESKLFFKKKFYFCFFPQIFL